MFRSLVPSRCREAGALLSPSTLLRLPAALCGAGPALHTVPVFGSSTKARARLRLLFASSPPERLRQPGACRALSPRVRAPSPLRGPSLSFHPRLSGARARRVPAPCVSPRPSRRVWTIQNLRTSLNRDWRPACSAVGARSSGPSLPLSSTPCLQSPRGWAGPQPAGSSLHLLGPFVLRTAESVFGLVNFLSLFCCPTV